MVLLSNFGGCCGGWSSSASARRTCRLGFRSRSAASWRGGAPLGSQQHPPEKQAQGKLSKKNPPTFKECTWTSCEMTSTVLFFCQDGRPPTLFFPSSARWPLEQNPVPVSCADAPSSHQVALHTLTCSLLASPTQQELDNTYRSENLFFPLPCWLKRYTWKKTPHDRRLLYLKVWG